MLVARAPLRDLGRMLRSGQLTSLDLTEHVLAGLDNEGRALNAVVTLMPERAIEAARVADDEISRGVDRGPLHGIPYGAKDLLATAGSNGNFRLWDAATGEEVRSLGPLAPAGVLTDLESVAFSRDTPRL